VKPQSGHDGPHLDGDAIGPVGNRDRQASKVERRERQEGATPGQGVDEPGRQAGCEYGHYLPRIDVHAPSVRGPPAQRRAL